MATNKRAERRQPLDCKCWIVAKPGEPGIPAHMGDISVSGARIIASDPAAIPDEFFLYLTKDGRVGRQCRIVRRSEDDIGVIFVRKGDAKRTTARPSA